MSLSLLINALAIILGLALVFSKRFSHLRLVQLYAFGSVAIGLAYKHILFLYTWNFYLFVVSAQAILFALAYWEVTKKLDKRNLYWVWPVLVAIISVSFLPIPFFTKLALPFMILNLFIAFEAPFVFKSKNLFLLTWVMMSSFALALGALKLSVPTQEGFLALRTFEVWPRVLGDFALLLVVAWQPLMAWLSPKLQQYLNNANMTPVPVVAGNNETMVSQADVINFPGGIQNTHSGDTDGAQLPDDLDLLEPLLMSATRMISLSNKPFLNREELRDYLDLDEEQIEGFLEKYNISRMQLLDDEGQWVVRRQDVEGIPSGNSDNPFTPQKL